MTKYLLIVFVLFSNTFYGGLGCFLKPPAQVHVTNNLPPNSNLLVHCSSKNDDLGYHTLGVNQEYSFSFCVIPLTTLFSCRLSWANKTTGFEAYNAKWNDNRCAGHTEKCYYEAKIDGVYLNGKLYYPW